MLAILLVTALVATTASAMPAGAISLPNKPVPGSLSMVPSEGFKLRNGDINGLALLQSLNETLLRYHSPVLRPLSKGSLLDLEVPADEEATDVIPASAGLNANTILDRRAYGEPLIDDVDRDYDGYITVGSQSPTRFLMQFDTGEQWHFQSSQRQLTHSGSPYIIVPGVNCTAVQGCPHASKYTGSATPLEANVNFTYSGGDVSGNEFADVVTIAGLTVTNQTVLSIDTATTTANVLYDGVCGMSFSGAAQGGSTTFFENMLEQNLVSVPEFSIFLGRAYNGTGSASQVALGGRNTSLFSGPVTTVPVAQDTVWIIDIEGIAVNGYSVGASVKGLAAVDTGTSLVIVPLEMLPTIFAPIPGAVAIPLSGLGTSTSQMYAYPCNTSASLIPSIILNGKTFPIALQDFNVGALSPSFVSALATQLTVSETEVTNRDLCVAGIAGIVNDANPNLFVLGDVFLKGWYSIYGYGEDWPANKTGTTVGFAQVVQDSGVPSEASTGLPVASAASAAVPKASSGIITS